MKHPGRHPYRAFTMGSRRKKIVMRCEKCGKPKPTTAKK